MISIPLHHLIDNIYNLHKKKTIPVPTPKNTIGINSCISDHYMEEKVSNPPHLSLL